MGAGQPAVEGELAGFGRQTDGHEAEGRDQGEDILAAAGILQNFGVQVRHEQVARAAVENGQAQQEQAGTHAVEDHVPDGGDDGRSRLAGHDQRAAGNGADLQKHIACKQVIGVDQHHQRGGQQVQHQKVDALFAPQNIVVKVLMAAQQREQHDAGKAGRQKPLQGAGPQLVAPRGREVSQPVCKAGAGLHRADGDNDGKAEDQHRRGNGQPVGHVILSEQRRRDACQHGQDDAEKWKILIERKH